MPTPFIEDRAKLAPSKCVVSGSGDGPIINTGMDYGDFSPRGRIYIAPRSIAHLLRDLGWVDPDDAAELHERHDADTARIAELEDELERLRPLGEAVEAFATHTVEEVVVEKEVYRKPTAQDIRDFIDEHPDDPRVERLEEVNTKSTEFWFDLYGPDGPLTPEQRKQKEAEKRRANAKATRQINRDAVKPQNPTELSEPEGEHDPTAPPKVVKLHSQDVNLDDLLDGTVKDVVDFIEGHPAAFQEAVLKREVYRAEQKGDKPRVTLTKAVADNLKEPASV